MTFKTKPALLGAALTLALMPAVASAKTSVTVRIEGAKKTLLGAESLAIPSGSVTHNGAPAGKCSASSAAGVLDSATHHRWAGSFNASYNDFFVTGILGESYGSTAKSYWEVLVNDVASQAGACGTKLHRGDRVLFAVVPVTGTANPLVLKGPAKAKVGSTITVTVDQYVGTHIKAASKVKVTGGPANETSNGRGQVKLHVTKAGTLTLRAAGKGYIRAAALVIKAHA